MSFLCALASLACDLSSPSACGPGAAEQAKRLRARKPLCFIAVAILVGLLFVGCPAFLNPDAYLAASLQGAFITVTIAAGLVGVSGIVGFLFGIPRASPNAPAAPAVSAVASAPAAGAAAPAVSAGTAAQPGPQPADLADRYGSLQQIADWLIKLLLGAGLTQLDKIYALVLQLARAIASTVSASGGAPGVVFGLGLIGYFVTCGFMGGYLATRLVLERLLLEEDISIDKLRHEAHEQGAREARDTIVTQFNQAGITRQTSAGGAATAGFLATNVTTTPTADSVAASEWQPTGAPAHADDPQKGRFGGKSATANRSLSATVAPLTGSNDLFVVTVEVAALGAAPALTAPVKFFLHHTFKPDTAVVTPQNNIARLEFVAWGAFTVGAITDNGATLLEIDLAQLPSAPTAFRER